MKYDQNILDYCLEEWNENFSGIVSCDVSDDLNIDHKEVRNAFKRLKKRDKGVLTDEVRFPDQIGSKKESGVQMKERIATIFYPSQAVLTDYFHASGLAKQDLPPFRKMLHLGHRKHEMRYFSRSVLERYLENPEKYNIEDLPAGGFFSSNLNYTFELSSEEVLKKCFSVKRYGKIHTEEGESVITTVIKDLAALPASEQKHWLNHQIEAPVGSDLEFQKYYLKFFKGAPTDSNDPLHDLINLLQEINSLPHLGELFKKLDNPNLKYPVQNTYENFRECCKQLYKHIGSRSLNYRILKRFLRKNFNLRNADLRHKRRLKLFKKFLDKFELFDNSISELTNKVKNQQMLDLQNSGKDYLMEFKKICQSLLISYRILFEKLKVEDSLNRLKTDESLNQMKKLSLK